MAALISGTIFNDINNNGVYDSGTDSGIPNVIVVLQSPAGTCSQTTSSSTGNYSFTNLTLAGNYTLYETVSSPDACPPTTFTQPMGFTSSTTQRVLTLTLTQTEINNNTTLNNKNFGHNNPDVFTCSAAGIQVADNPAHLYSVDLVSGTSTDLGLISPSDTYNGIGYSIVDNAIYGSVPSGLVVRINSDATADLLAPVNGLPSNIFNVGDVDLNGRLYLYGSTLTRFYVVDVNPNSPTYLKLLDPQTGFTVQTSNFGVPIASTVIADWAFSPRDGQLYSVQYNTGNALRINPITGVITTLTSTGLPATGQWGAMFFDANGNLYAIDNLTGIIYRILLSGSTATGAPYSTSIPASNNDGSRCPLAVVPALTVTKQVDLTTAHLGDTLTYTLIVKNVSSVIENSIVLTDPIPNGTTYIAGSAKVNGFPASGTPSSGILVGNLAPDESATVTFKVLIGNTPPNPNPIANTAQVSSSTNGPIYSNTVTTAVVVPPVCPAPVFQTITNTTTASGTVTATGGTSPIVYSITTQPLDGTATVNSATGDWTYTPYPNTIGKDSFVITATDKNKETCTVTVTLTIMASLICPAPITQTITNTAIASGTITATGGTLPITYSISTQPLNGTATINSSTGAWTYTPHANFEGKDVLVVTATDSTGQICTVTVTLNVIATLICPAPLTQTITNTSTASGTVTTTDGTPPITYSISTPPVNGTATINSSTGVWIYTPNTGFVGKDVFVITSTDSNGKTCTVTATITVTAVMSPNIKIIKSGLTTATPGQTFTYSFTITNTGTADASNFVLTDIIPAGTTFVAGSTLIGNTPSIDNPATGINLGTLAVGGVQTVSFKVTVNSNISPIPTTLNNVATSTYNYIPSPGGNPVPGNTTSNTVNTNITPALTPKITIKKFGPTTANPGETFTYSFIIVNSGTIDVSNFILTDLIPAGTTFVAGSTLVDFVPSTANPATGINLGTLASGDSHTVSFKVSVNKNVPTPTTLSNSATSTYSYKPSPDSPPVQGNTTSNTTHTTVAPTAPSLVCSAPISQVVSSACTPVGSVAAIGGIPPITYSISTLPCHGTATIDHLTGIWNYKPHCNFVGKDSFVITATDSTGQTCIIPVTLDITGPCNSYYSPCPCNNPNFTPYPCDTHNANPYSLQNF